MDVARCASALEFLELTRGYRGTDPLRTNVLGSVAVGVAEGLRRYDECFWWVVSGDAGQVAGAAMRTPPFGLSLGPMPDDAAATLADSVARADDSFPGVAGPASSVSAFIDRYSRTGSSGSGRLVESTRRDVLYVVDQLVVPSVEGEERVAVIKEFDRAASWYSAFAEEVDGVARTPSVEDLDALRETLRSKRLHWWLVEGRVVSMAGHAVAVESPGGSVTRVGPVYTPPEERGHGYAAAVTAAVTALLIDRGSTVMLYADEANATSNAVYRRLGYELLDVFVRCSLATPQPPGSPAR